MLLISKYRVEGFFVCKVIKVEGSGNLEGVVTIDVSVHLLSKDRDQFDGLSDRT